jgi:hypothetical protein
MARSQAVPSSAGLLFLLVFLLVVLLGVVLGGGLGVAINIDGDIDGGIGIGIGSNGAVGSSVGGVGAVGSVGSGSVNGSGSGVSIGVGVGISLIIGGAVLLLESRGESDGGTEGGDGTEELKDEPGGVTVIIDLGGNVGGSGVGAAGDLLGHGGGGTVPLGGGGGRAGGVSRVGNEGHDHLNDGVSEGHHGTGEEESVLAGEREDPGGNTEGVDTNLDVSSSEPGGDRSLRLDP